jgi:cell wall assembly regulator SMI1
MSDDSTEGAKKKKRKSADAPTPVVQPALNADGHLASDPFASFVTVLKEKDPDLGNLEKSAKQKDVDDAEKKLSTALPPLFKSFLLRWNGGTAHETCIYGVGTGDEFDLVDLNVRARADDLPDHLIGFAATVQGEIYCFDTSRKRENGESPVVLVDADEGRQYEAATDFADWLDKLPTLETELADQRGPQPMTVEEWEEFLKREREKLRRLSKTPARELPMPDPETARQDLGGKIPVDPRHLKPKGGV